MTNVALHLSLLRAVKSATMSNLLLTRSVTVMTVGPTDSRIGHQPLRFSREDALDQANSSKSGWLKHDPNV